MPNGNSVFVKISFLRNGRYARALIRIYPRNERRSGSLHEIVRDSERKRQSLFKDGARDSDNTIHTFIIGV